jgi:pimeloyl-ACP methyl ester carboxylesterase
MTSGPFRLLALARHLPRPGSTLSVYIEGDGAPWMTPWHPPRDPTPVKPVVLMMAAADTAEAVVYLGRPCQYLPADELATCDLSWWAERRFAPEVLRAYDEALSRLKAGSGAQQLRLIGYSGGGVIAALLAARRPDVVRLVTVAAPLALNEWAAWHDLTPFADTTDPMLAQSKLPMGIHWVGGQDKIVPVGIVEKFVQSKGGRMRIAPGYDHECCWARDWASLIVKENGE